MEKELTEVSKAVRGCGISITPQERKEFLRILWRLTASYFGYGVSLIMDTCKGKDCYD